MLLAIDTATRRASVALYNGDGLVAETNWRSRENHTVELMVQIVRLLDLVHVPKSDVQAIGVALGPGSFTGLRVGMSVAKGLAFACQVPILGIPTLDAVAHAHAWQSMPIWAILAAGRGRYSVACYSAGHGVCERVSDYALVDAAGLVGLVSCRSDGNDVQVPRVLLCGDLDAALAQRFKQHMGTRAVIASPALNARRAGFLAELAWARFQRGESDDAASLVPIYMAHESVEGTKRTKDQ